MDMEQSVELVKQVFVPDYTEAVRKALPWMSRLTIVIDDETREWSASYMRNGTEYEAILGMDLPKTPEAFCRIIKKSMATNVDHGKMNDLAKELEDWGAQPVEEKGKDLGIAMRSDEMELEEEGG